MTPHVASGPLLMDPVVLPAYRGHPRTHALACWRQGVGWWVETIPVEKYTEPTSSEEEAIRRARRREWAR